MRFEILPAEASHITAMQGRWRPEDVAELWASAHRTPEEALARGMSASPLCWTACVGTLPVAMFGVSPAAMIGGIGCPWMVGTVELDRYAYRIMRQCRPLLARMLLTFEHLVNFVDARNTRAIRWLVALGFQFSPAAPHGVEGLPFYRFEMRRANV
jgi:hypothetical protein